MIARRLYAQHTPRHAGQKLEDQFGDIWRALERENFDSSAGAQTASNDHHCDSVPPRFVCCRAMRYWRNARGLLAVLGNKMGRLALCMVHHRRIAPRRVSALFPSGFTGFERNLLDGQGPVTQCLEHPQVIPARRWMILRSPVYNQVRPEWVDGVFDERNGTRVVPHPFLGAKERRRFAR
ncbi:hypothetical protein L226DRAFT_353955 [Lentinus tigrinus ALCF2SS1-7]|uniref:uncharacterized protein n=1 Tax=Lentinus tigrinus ALCF2SS1-7 TaxID=1328758 RepID=UPI0011662F30|nr:hypothetical protein L226DRAFT_353955 [Lentinus tigrinus ALCF2SS1-7]